MIPVEEVNGIIKDDGGIQRCWWCGTDPLYVQYHDDEWGNPVRDDRLLFEKMCLEGFQAGLAWITVLKKREAFREAFCNFDFHQIARFDQDDIDRLVTNTNIIRHRGKINTSESTALSKALKKNGWTFVGPTTCYALMQAVGMVDDHLPQCFRKTNISFSINRS